MPSFNASSLILRRAISEVPVRRKIEYGMLEPTTASLSVAYELIEPSSPPLRRCGQAPGADGGGNAALAPERNACSEAVATCCSHLRISSGRLRAKNGAHGVKMISMLIARQG